jgi:ribosomal 30S subunit maturation factor RimM
VADFLEMPAHPLLVLRDGKVERLVPLVPERLVAVDLVAGRVTVDWHPDD